MLGSRSFFFVVASFASPEVFAQTIPIAEDAPLVASDMANGDEFGRSCALDGEQIIVGAPFNALGITSAEQGAAYVFRRSGTMWSEEFRLTTSDGADADRFGWAVAMSGEWAAIGAPNDDDNGTSSGSVYIFQRSGTAWVQVDKIVRTGGGAGDEFGKALAMQGDNLVVGAPTDDEAISEGGAAFVYVRSGTDWNLEDTLLGSTTESMDLFGSSVAIDGDRVAVGSSLDEAANAQLGKAHVFLRTGTTWAEEFTTGPPDGANFAHMGRSIGISGDILAAGAPERADTGGIVGAVYVFRRSGTDWNPEDTLLASDGAANDFFGAALGLDGDRLVVGSPFHSGAGSNAGAAYLFQVTGTTWSEEGKILAFAAPGDRFGTSVTVDNRRFAVGAILGEVDEAQPGVVFPFRTPDFITRCFGDGGVSAGCTDCPCSNNAAPGSGGGCLNSAGTGSRLVASGSPSVSLPMSSGDDLRFEATNGPPSQLFILNAGDALAPNNPANPCFGLDSGTAGPAFDGLRCAIVNTLRNGGRGADSNGEVGITNAGWGGGDNPPGGIAVFFGYAAGSTRFFQGIHRDTIAVNCGTGLNTTNAVGVTFFP